ncbi:protein of unassigned function [Methylobacterium oryzae CBMB20]|uniref:Protein of unassigned function n=1 Tax=Methylobacterium oryzae CBMB20 TaxID=693986 RepID=A0A089NVX4_9HYPH|nr:protein of unassigned function [Methylobacterium oryzae CBMB20]
MVLGRGKRHHAVVAVVRGREANQALPYGVGQAIPVHKSHPMVTSWHPYYGFLTITTTTPAYQRHDVGFAGRSRWRSVRASGRPGDRLGRQGHAWRDAGSKDGFRRAPRAYSPWLRFTTHTTESITGTSISTPTTVAGAAPELKPNRLIAAATASSKKFGAPIGAENRRDEGPGRLAAAQRRVGPPNAGPDARGEPCTNSPVTDGGVPDVGFPVRC